MAVIRAFVVIPGEVSCRGFVRIRVAGDFASPGDIVVQIEESFPCVFIWNGMRTKILQRQVLNPDQQSVEFRCRMECAGSFPVPLRALVTDDEGSHADFRTVFVRC